MKPTTAKYFPPLNSFLTGATFLATIELVPDLLPKDIRPDAEWAKVLCLAILVTGILIRQWIASDPRRRK